MEKNFINKIIFGKYQIIKLIGKIAYSKVFSVRNLSNKKIFAMKVQDKYELYGNLEEEAYNLYILKGLGIPKIITYGYHRQCNILVMELLGKSIEQLFIENINIDKKLRIKDIILTGIQMIDRIEFIHSKNLLHLDIKPNNFLVGEPDSSLLYIIDFGFSKKYKSSRTGKHIQYSKKNYFNGNLFFSSVKTMAGVEPSRRDDLESLGYVLINLFSKGLPWKNISFKNKNEYALKAYRLKKTISLNTLCKDSPEEMIDFMKYVKSLKFEEEPNYNYLRNLLQNVIKEYKDPHFSWANKALIKIGGNYINKNIKKKRVSPYSKIFNKLGSKSLMSEKINKIQTISDTKFETIGNNYEEKLSLDIVKSENGNYNNNNESESNENILNKYNNYNELKLKRLDVPHKNKKITYNYTFNHINQLNQINQINKINHINHINNNILKLNIYKNNEIYSTIGINANTHLDEKVNFDQKIIINPDKYKTNNKYSASSLKLNYLNKNFYHSQYNKKTYLNHDQSKNSSQILKDKNNNENDEQKDNYQTIINNGLYRNIVYKSKFSECH